MEITIHGRNSIISKKEMAYVTEFFARKLMGKRLSKNLEIEIYNRTFKTKREMGYCFPHDDRPHRHFAIELNKMLSYPNQIETLAHEMVHVKQFARGEWKEIGNGHHKWLGKSMYVSDEEYDKKYRSLKLPWEKEAVLSESWLGYFYREHCRINNLKMGKSNGKWD